MYYNFDIENLRYQLCTKAESSFRQMEICKFWKSVTCPQKKFWLRYDLEAIYVKKKAMRNSTKYKFYLNQITQEARYSQKSQADDEASKYIQSMKKKPRGSYEGEAKENTGVQRTVATETEGDYQQSQQFRELKETKARKSHWWHLKNMMQNDGQEYYTIRCWECIDDWLRGRRVNQRRQEGENKRESRALDSEYLQSRIIWKGKIED